jgi:diacylglycerol kinase
MKQLSQPPRPPWHKHIPKDESAKFIGSFSYAFQGIGYAIRTQRNLRIHITIAIVVVLLGLFFHVSAVEFAMLFIAITGVFISEMFNTVAELCVDLASPTYHPLAKTAKDVAAGAVLANAILSVIIGLCIFGPHIYTLLSFR